MAHRSIKRFIRALLRRGVGGDRPLILMYHRIADVAWDPWGLAVSPDHFAEQMQVLRDARLPLAMDDLVARLARGSLPRNAIAVTFDDGYVDNLLYAQPVLDRLVIPATVFVTTQSVGVRREFWWDELTRLILARGDAVSCTFALAGEAISLQLPERRTDAAGDRSWRAWNEPMSARQRAYIDMWQRLQGLPAAVRDESMRSLRTACELCEPEASALPLTQSELSRLMESALITLGAHSRSHPRLSTLSDAEQRDEIDGSRIDCGAFVAGAVTGFSYPHGDRSPAVIEMTRQSGFDWACSTRSATVDPSSYDRFDLPRLQVLDWTGVQFRRALRQIGPTA